MKVEYSFERFDPLNGEVPLDMQHGIPFTDIAQRARRMLSGRSLDELTDGLDTLTWMLEEGEKLQEQEAYRRIEDHGEDAVVIARNKALKLYMPLFDISNQHRFPNATWPDYFALMALAEIGLALDSPDNHDIKALYASVNIDPDIADTQSRNLIDEYLVESLEAVCYAEC